MKTECDLCKKHIKEVGKLFKYKNGLRLCKKCLSGVKIYKSL